MFLPNELFIDLKAKLWDSLSMQALDQFLFQWINIHLANPVFDQVMPFITDLHKRQGFVWIALPIILAAWFFKKRKKALPVFVTLVLCISAADLFTYRVLKPTFARTRPAVAENEIILRTDRYAGYSFPSNHAANNFAGATLLSFCYPALTPVFMGVAALIAFSRVYVGVHYPFDVMAGAVLGLFFGLFFFKLMVIILTKVRLRKPHAKWIDQSLILRSRN